MVYRGICRPKVCYITLSFAWSYISETFCTQDSDKNETRGSCICKITVGSAGGLAKFFMPWTQNDLYKMAICSWSTVFRKPKSQAIGFICRNACLFGNLCYVPIQIQTLQQQRPLWPGQFAPRWRFRGTTTWQRASSTKTTRTSKTQWVHFRSWTKLRRCGWCTRCLDNVRMPFCKAWHCWSMGHICNPWTRIHPGAKRSSWSNKGPTWFWSRPPIVAPKLILFTTMDFWWFLFLLRAGRCWMVEGVKLKSPKLV